MIMKTISKLLSVLIVYGVADNANAQKRDAGEWSIIPKVGVKLAKLKGDKIGIGDADNNFLNFSSKLGYLIRRNIVMSFVLCTFVCIANAVPKGEAAKVRSIIDKVNNSWQSRNNPEATPFWHVAAYHTGNMEAYRLTGNKKYLDYSMAWAEHNKWKGATSNDRNKWKYNYGETQEHVLFGDWQICFQTYLDLYNILPDDNRIRRAREVMEYEMSTKAHDYWWWADGLYMVMPVMTKLYKATGNERYLDKRYEYIQ